MQVVVIGAGPVGLLVGSALANRGHDVVAVERDAGPPRHGHWARRGVMQFHHAHGFRPQVAEVLEEVWPAALDAWLALGAEPITSTSPVSGRYRLGTALAGRPSSGRSGRPHAAYRACRSAKATSTACAAPEGGSPAS